MVFWYVIIWQHITFSKPLEHLVTCTLDVRYNIFKSRDWKYQNQELTWQSGMRRQGACMKIGQVKEAIMDTI